MNKMNRFVPLLLFLVITISACGNSRVAPAAEGDIAAAVNGQPAELNVYFPYPADWPEEEFMKTFGQPIMNKFPHITVKYIPGGKISELLAAGQKIDIVFASIGASPGSLLDYKLESDIGPLIKQADYNLNRLEPTMLDTARQLAGGGIYGLPVYTTPAALYYNKDLFDKFGVPYPKDGLTWDDLYELSKSMTRTDGGVNYTGLGSSYGHLAMMNQQSIPIVYTDTKKSAYDTDLRWKSFADNLIRFYKLPGYAAVDPGKISEPHERNRFFKDRTVAMFLGISALYTSQEIGNMNWDLAAFPVLKEMPDMGPQAYPTYFYVTSISQQKDRAFEAIAYLTSEEYQSRQIQDGKFLTSLNDKELRERFGKNNPMYAGKNSKALQPDKYAPAGSVNKYNGPNNGEFVTIVRDVVYNNKDVNTALREAAERVNKKIQQAEASAVSK